MQFRGAHVAITGAADGIGRALALEAAGRGAAVSLLDIRGEAAEAVAGECQGRGAASIAFGCDVSDRTAVMAAAEASVAALGPVNLIWANAGIGIRRGLLDADWTELDWLYGVNLFGVIATVRAFMPLLAPPGRFRHVAVTGSMAAMAALEPGRPSAYGASKYAVAGVAEALRCELAPLGVGVTLFSPGSIDTGKRDAGRARPARFGGPIVSNNIPTGPRPTPLSAEQAAAKAVDAVLAGQFHCLIPESETRAALVGARGEQLAAHMTTPDRLA